MKYSKAPQTLSRAKFFKVGAAVVGGGIGAYALYQLAPWINPSAVANSARTPLRLGETGDARARELIRFATLAASGHNAQPWQFIVAGDQIQIVPDLSRRLPAVDPNDRELWISLGCVLENLSIAAQAYGFTGEINYPDNTDRIEFRLVAGKRSERSMIDAIPRRQQTRSIYDGKLVSSDDLKEIAASPSEPGISFRLFDGQSKTDKLLEFIRSGDQHQFADKAFVDELIRWVRFDRREARVKMDGLFSRCMGTPEVPRWLGQQVLGHMKSQTQFDSDAKDLRSSAGTIAIESSSDDKDSWVRTGQVYQRLTLKLTSMNIKTAFLNQPIEVPELRQQFQSALGFGGLLPQLLFRFGYADPMPSSLRQPVNDVIVWS